MADIRKFFGNPWVAGLMVGTCMFAMCADDALAGRGGGRGGGGGMSRGGGGGGRMAQSSVSGGNRSAASRSSSAGGSRGSNAGSRGGGERASSRGGGSGGRSVERNGGDRTRTSGDRTTNIGSNNNVNIEGRDVNIDVEGGWGGGCCWGGVRHPIAAGVTIGAIAGMTAAAVGSYYYALPPTGCTVVVQNGVQYHQCGTAYYSEAMDGDEIVYVSVEP